MWGRLAPALRPDLFHGNRGQRDNGAEHITLDKFRRPTGVELCVFVSIPHPGPRLIRQSDLSEHFRDGRVLGIRLKGGQVQSAVSVGTVGVLRIEPVTLDYKLCHIAAGVIPVLCEVNSYAKSLPEPLILWEIRQLLLCINFSILQVVFQPVDQILLLFLSVFMNCFYRYAMLLQLFFLNPWIRFRIDFRCDY